jgi:hypothetical protein
MSKFIDLVGRRFGELTIIKRVIASTKKAKFLCLCSCGREVEIFSSVLRSTGRTRCNLKHGYSATDRVLYSRWNSMKRRCYNKNELCFSRYGGKGIKVCSEWLSSFKSFKEWSLANGYKPSLSIDRIDTNGDYCPNNCRWTNAQVQAANRAYCHRITRQGKTMVIAEWERELGVKPGTLKRRSQAGWSDERIIDTPIRKITKSKI